MTVSLCKVVNEVAESSLILKCTMNNSAPRMHLSLLPLMVFILSLLQLMWRGMPEILWKLPKSFNYILLVYNVRISQPRLNNLERLSEDHVVQLVLSLLSLCFLNGCAVSFFQEIDAMEEELRIKTELIKKHERLIQGWKKDLKDQLDKHNTELERV